jgi:hypothetical protein
MILGPPTAIFRRLISSKRRVVLRLLGQSPYFDQPFYVWISVGAL